MATEKYKVGDKFNWWTVLEKLPGRANYKWRCQCACGTIKDVNANNVYTGKSKSCGPCGAKRREREKREQK